MNPFLSPIEKPRGLMMKLAYYFTRKQFGKVLTPVKVHAAGLPAAFGLSYAKVGRLDKKLTLPPEAVLLIPPTGGAPQHLRILRGHRQVVHHQSVDEPSQIRCAGSIRHESSLYR